MGNFFLSTGSILYVLHTIALSLSSVPTFMDTFWAKFPYYYCNDKVTTQSQNMAKAATLKGTRILDGTKVGLAQFLKEKSLRRINWDIQP